MATTVTIAVFNLSTELSDDQVMGALPALQTQISRDFAPVYGTDANLATACAVLHDASASNAQLGHAGHIKAPLELVPGGYIGVFDLVGTGWTQLVPSSAAITYRDRPPVGSRRERRRTPREQWLRSAPTGKYQ